MKRFFIVFPLLLLFSGCIDMGSSKHTSEYLTSVEGEMQGLSTDLEKYIADRDLFNNGTIDQGEAYDNAVMGYMKNQDAVVRLSQMNPPEGFENFHELILTSAEHLSSAYKSDMTCIRGTVNESCANASALITLAQEKSDEAVDELGSLGIAVT